MRARVIPSVSLAILLGTRTVGALSPPQYGLEQQLKSSVGVSPQVSVRDVFEEEGQEEVGKYWVIEVHALASGPPGLPEALATALKPLHDFDGLRVYVRVLDAEGNRASPAVASGDPIEQTAALLSTALSDNPLFVRIHNPTGWPFDLSVEFAAGVIQYWDNNIGDHYGNTNLVAAQVFEQVLNPLYFDTVAVGTTTSPALGLPAEGKERGVLKLSPPQYSLERQLKRSVGVSPHVDVKDIFEEPEVGGGSHYVIEVQALISGGPGLASSLASVVRREYNFGGIRVLVRVLDPAGNEASPAVAAGDPIEQTVELLSAALLDNPLFVKIHNPTGWPLDLSVEFAAAVIQYWNDDIGDHYGNTNLVAADVFSSVLNEYYFERPVSVGTSTSPVVPPSRMRFVRADSNADGTTDLSDAVAILNFLFLGQNKVPCEQAGDANDDGGLDISDAVYVLSFLFLGGKPIAPPVQACGFEPTGHSLPCESFPRCQ